MSIRLILALLLTLTALAFVPPAQAGSGACSVTAAKREMVRARAEYREAVRVYKTTRHFSQRYSPKVVRWVKLSHEVGWPWREMDILMMVIDRESGGAPKAKNPTSTASGLMQFLAFHWDGSGDYGWRFDPFNPRSNLLYGHKLWKKLGWQPWAIQ